AQAATAEAAEAAHAAHAHTAAEASDAHHAAAEAVHAQAAAEAARTNVRQAAAEAVQTIEPAKAHHAAAEAAEAADLANLCAIVSRNARRGHAVVYCGCHALGRHDGSSPLACACTRPDQHHTESQCPNTNEPCCRVHKAPFANRSPWVVNCVGSNKSQTWAQRRVHDRPWQAIVASSRL